MFKFQELLQVWQLFNTEFIITGVYKTEVALHRLFLSVSREYKAILNICCSSSKLLATMFTNVARGSSFIVLCIYLYNNKYNNATAMFKTVYKQVLHTSTFASAGGKELP